MEQQQFFYSKWYAWYPFIYFSFLFGLLSLNKRFWVANRFSDPWVIAPLVFVAGSLIYNLVKYIVPMFQGKTFLEMDSEKIYVRPKNKVVYWADVEKIIYGDFPDKVILKLYNKEKIRIYIQNIKGDNEFIYKTVIACHKKATQPVTHDGESWTGRFDGV